MNQLSFAPFLILEKTKKQTTKSTNKQRKLQQTGSLQSRIIKVDNMVRRTTTLRLAAKKQDADDFAVQLWLVKVILKRTFKKYFPSSVKYVMQQKVMTIRFL